MLHLTSNISGDSAIIALDNRRNAEENTTSKAYENKKTFIKIILAGNFLCIYKNICQLYDTEHLAATPRRSEDGGQIDLDPEQLTIKRSMSQARGDTPLKLTANRDTLIQRASEQAEFARLVEIGQLCSTSESVRGWNQLHSLMQIGQLCSTSESVMAGTSSTP